MNGVRVLVGTKKGAFILTADGKRQRREAVLPQTIGIDNAGQFGKLNDWRTATAKQERGGS